MTIFPLYFIIKLNGSFACFEGDASWQDVDLCKLLFYIFNVFKELASWEYYKARDILLKDNFIKFYYAEIQIKVSKFL